MRYVSGWVLTEDGLKEGSLGFEDGLIHESTDQKVKSPIAEGIIMPTFTNAHTHIGDSFISEEVSGTLREIVAPPDGLKHRRLREAKREEIVDSMRHTIERMFGNGITTFCDFREGGLDGVSMLFESCLGLPVEPIVFGRPADMKYDGEEMASLLRVVNGIGISSVSDWDYSELQKISRSAGSEGLRFALHASEEKREDIDLILDLKPSFLVHMTCATDSDLEICTDNDTPVVLCPRSRAFFGNLPDIPRMLSKGITLMLGTDNAMISSPSIWDEMKFAYYLGKSQGDMAVLDVLRMVLNSRKGLKGEGALGTTVGSKPDFMVLAPQSRTPHVKQILGASEKDISLICKGEKAWRMQHGELIEIGQREATDES
jgi:cytosine/adenosine deaminase-related metal-dependent hydrolase